MGTDDSSLFKALEQRRAFEEIIVQIREAIAEGRLRPGDRLPAERDLAAAFGVSRASVREALRVLEMFGVVVARRGKGPDSGSLVAANAQVGIENALGMQIALLRIPTQDIVDIRGAIESLAGERAAAAMQPGATDRLREIVAEMRAATSIGAYNQLDTDFHVELARVSRNVLLPVLMEALRGVMRRAMLDGFLRIPDWRVERDRLVEEHAGIVTLIEAGDREGAGRAIREHVERFYARATAPAGALALGHNPER